MPTNDDEPIPAAYWYLVLGTGPPPTRSNLLRMASERRAVHRAGIAAEEARRETTAKAKESRKEALTKAKESRKDAIAKAKADHPLPDLMSTIKKRLGLGKKKGNEKDSMTGHDEEESLTRRRTSAEENNARVTSGEDNDAGAAATTPEAHPASGSPNDGEDQQLGDDNTTGTAQGSDNANEPTAACGGGGGGGGGGDGTDADKETPAAPQTFKNSHHDEAVGSTSSNQKAKDGASSPVEAISGDEPDVGDQIQDSSKTVTSSNGISPSL